jgi:DNA processing protein
MTHKSEQLAAGIWLSKMTRTTGLGNKTIGSLLEYAGEINCVFGMNTKTILELVSGPPEKVSKVQSFLKDEKYRELSREEGLFFSKQGIRLLTIMDAAYPEKLKTISTAPALLYMNGENSEMILAKEYAVAIVGTRTPTPYGIAVTKKFVTEIARRDVVIISGLARGIDSLAHQTALENKGLTLAVLGCGLDIVYPPENREIMARIIQEGSIISECPPGTKPFKSYFPARNRIISGLSDCVAVMEASKKSGTMITAGYAGEQGRDLFAVPGSIFSTHSDGTNQLIQDGACVLTNVEDMLWKIPFQKIQNIANIEKATKSPSIQDILLHTEKSADEIAEDLGMSVSEASGMLSFMELSGEIIFQNGRFSLTDSYKYSINYNEQRNMH